jgi:peptidoglycan hydrolase CwlO-like protein
MEVKYMALDKKNLILISAIIIYTIIIIFVVIWQKEVVSQQIREERVQRVKEIEEKVQNLQSRINILDAKVDNFQKETSSTPSD